MLIERIMGPFDLRRDIWNNDQSDPAALYDNAGALIHREPITTARYLHNAGPR